MVPASAGGAAAAREQAPAPARSYYRRPLPASCVAFSDAAGRRLFSEALSSGGAAGYFRLAETFQTQAEPAYCGLAALAMVLNALAVDPRRVWKSGPWRWFDETLLDCCVPLPTVQREGIVLEALACLARCNGAAVSARRAPPAEGTPVLSAHAASAAAALMPEATFEEFEADVRDACFAPRGSGDGDVPPAHVLLASYSRPALGQTGDGHFSPLAAFAPESRMVLILDVARFKYPPHWVQLEALWEAMRRPDPATGLPRGYLRLSAARREGAAPPGAFMTLSLRAPEACNGSSVHDEKPALTWLAFLTGSALAHALAAPPGEDALPPALALRAAAARVLHAAASLPDLATALELYVPSCAAAAAARDAVRDAARATPLAAALAAEGCDGICSVESTTIALTMLLMAAPEAAWARAAPAVRQAAVAEAAAVADEVAHVRAQLTALTQPICCADKCAPGGAG
jgi:glutathione gamma-glutamylcysteinyltransferase